MSDELEDLRSFLEKPTLTLPIGGRKYVVQPCTGNTWLKLQKIDKGSKATNLEIFRLSLGKDVLDDMLEHATNPEIYRAGVTAWFWQIGNTAAAAEFWRSGGKALEAQASTPTKTQPATRTGGATTTRRRASGSGTSTRRKNSRSGKA